MPDVLINGDSMRSPEMRHEVPIAIPDPFLFAEHGGRRIAVVTGFEIQRITEADPRIEAIAPEKFGWDDLIASGKSASRRHSRCTRARAVRSGSSRPLVPARFPVEIADHLRAQGWRSASTASSSRTGAAARTQRRSPACAAHSARARPRSTSRGRCSCNATINGTLVLDGEPLTCERIKLAVERAFSEHGAFADEFIVSHGAQTAIGHDMGSGAILPNEPISFDLFPRDKETGVYSDMTRTYVVGDVPDELLEYHRLCKDVLERTTAAAGPGVNGRALMQIACDIFAEHGYPTQLTKQPGEVLDSGFFHGLGHGVGLEVHERPWMSVIGDDLVPGDVITLEPGLYRAGYGGLRLEDILIVTDDGVEVVTQYPYDLAP